MSYRGTTYSPAEEWHQGTLDEQARFALTKLEEVRGYLQALAGEAQAARRLRDHQRIYDLEDASRTIGDAARLLRTALEEK